MSENLFDLPLDDVLERLREVVNTFYDILDTSNRSEPYVDQLLDIRGKLSTYSFVLTYHHSNFLIEGSNKLSNSKIDHAIKKKEYLTTKEKKTGKIMSGLKAETLAREFIIYQKTDAENDLSESKAIYAYIMACKQIESSINQMVSNINKSF